MDQATDKLQNSCTLPGEGLKCVSALISNNNMGKPTCLKSAMIFSLGESSQHFVVVINLLCVYVYMML